MFLPILLVVPAVATVGETRWRGSCPRPLGLSAGNRAQGTREPCAPCAPQTSGTRCGVICPGELGKAVFDECFEESAPKEVAPEPWDRVPGVLRNVPE